MSLLAALLQGLTGQQPSQPNGNAGEVEGVTVTPRKKPTVDNVASPVPEMARNPFSPDYIAAVNAANQSQGQLPHVSGGTDQGLFGLLGGGMQHGKLRDILGTIGDGLLRSGGSAAQYQPRVDQRRQGQALIGYEQDPSAAAERLAQTGAPDSVKGAEGLFQNIQTSADKAAQRQQMAVYQQSQTRSRTDGILQRAGSVVPGVLARAQTPEDYANAYSRLNRIAKRIDPEADPGSAWGLPTPEEWDPSMTAWAGTTGGQQIGADVRRESIAQRREAAGTVHSDRQASLAQRATSSDVAHSDRQDSMQIRRDAAKNKSRNSGGGGGTKAPVVTNGDVKFLRNNPAQRANFEKHFGAGSAARFLGK